MIIHDVEQRSPEWYALRAGMPTASEFSKVVTSTGEPSKQAAAYVRTLAAELFAGKPLEAWEGNGWTERGREMEGQALALYEFAHDVEIVPVGFATDDTGHIGCSPDGLVGDAGMVEVKALKADRHIDAILYHQKHGRCPPDYVQQTQGQMMICARNWCDLIFFHPELPLLTIRQEPDLQLQAQLAVRLTTLRKDRDEILAVLQKMAERRAAA
jgi:hypothetical protein